MRARPAPTSEIEQFLLQLPLFTQLDKGTVRSLSSNSRFQQLEKGEWLFWESDPADCAYVLRLGRISIILNGPDGRELAIDEMRPGDIMGEISLLTSKNHSAGALAKTRVEVLLIPREAFLAAMDAAPLLARRILEITAHRLQQSARREMALAFLDAQARLAGHLLALEGPERDKGYVTASQEDLARGTGLIRQTVAKALGSWRRAGWLLTGRGRILVLNRKALERLARGTLP